MCSDHFEDDYFEDEPGFILQVEIQGFTVQLNSTLQNLQAYMYVNGREEGEERINVDLVYCAIEWL